MSKTSLMASMAAIGATGFSSRSTYMIERPVFDPFDTFKPVSLPPLRGAYSTLAERGQMTPPPSYVKRPLGKRAMRRERAKGRVK